MTKRDKLIALMISRPTTATFADVRAVLEMFGWELARTKGSHHAFKKPGHPEEGTIMVPVEGGTRVKKHYLDEVCQKLGLDELA
jgi:predicted RNA binding protein YcfA (HicA-like mRNA interferase family)